MPGFTPFRVFTRHDYPTEAVEGDLWEPNPHYAGFWAKVLANPTKGEVRQERQLFALVTDDASEPDWFKAVAARVPEWSLRGTDAAGEEVAIPAPGEGPDNWEAFELLPFDVLRWVVLLIQTAHVPKARPATMRTADPGTPSPGDAGSTATSSPDSTPPEPTPPVS